MAAAISSSLQIKQLNLIVKKLNFFSAAIIFAKKNRRGFFKVKKAKKGPFLITRFSQKYVYIYWLMLQLNMAQKKSTIHASMMQKGKNLQVLYVYTYSKHMFASVNIVWT